LFPNTRGDAYAYGGFNTAWTKLKAETNAALAECDVQLRIDDLHFHDLRSKAHDDAEDEGRPGHGLLGNTAASRRSTTAADRKECVRCAEL
jgi:hypothetical protein